MKAIQDLLRHTIGLHAATIGESAVERAAHARMRENRITRQEDYLKLLKHSPLEWSALVESVVVKETWFFRDPESMASLVQLVLTEWLPAHPTGSLRLLSVPCASGEEPYSMAMALLDAGVPPERFQIDALDISGRALIAAQHGRYGKNSFRGRNVAFRDRHFQSTREGWELNLDVRRQVRLHQGNFLSEQCLNQAGAHDYVFCRNLLIYFDSTTQEKAVQKLRGLLAPAGVLFMGPAELPLALGRGFAPAGRPLSFACRKTSDLQAASNHRAPSKAATPPKRVLRSGPPSAWPRSASTPSLPGVTRAAPENDASRVDLSEAQKLADAGRFAEAAEICEAHLRAQGVSAEAYYLLGLVRNAAGADSQASEFYRRALYLKPDHYQTLRQWASLSAKHGNEAHARMLHTRAERARRPDLRA